MCSSLIPCPLCTQPAFMNIDAFRTGLVSVATRHLSCPICSELLLGLDKLTIHMFAHLQGMRSENHEKETYSSVKDLDSSKKYPSIENSLLLISNNENKNFNSNLQQCKLKNKITNEQYTEINHFDTNSVSVRLCQSNDPTNTQNLPDITKKKLHILYDNSLSTVTPNDKFQISEEKSTYQLNTENNIKCSESISKELVNNTFVTYHSSQKLIQNVNNKQQEDNINNQNKVPENKPLSDFPCDLCGFKFNDEHILNLHFSLVHPTINDNNGVINIFPCHLCSKKFKMRGSLMIHLRVAHYGFSNMESQEKHNSSHNLTCSICNKIFTKTQHLATHIKTHENKQWECDVCTKMFTTKYFLKKHKRLHTGEMPYHCIQCNKAFTFQQSYHKHLQYHSTDKPHICSECGRAFKELSTLHNHQRIHSGERPFACETCGKCFRQRVSYLVHQRIHTGAMPYQCTACGKSFRYKVSQRTHKCPIQPPGTVVRQSGNLLQKLLQNSFEKSLHDQSQKDVCNFDITDHNNDNSINNYTKIRDNNGANSDISDNLAKQKINISGNSKDNENTTLIKNTDFFSMVLSPLNIPSPSEKMQNLSITTAEDRNISPSFEEYTNQDINHAEHDTLQTINEESLKQLLYGSENNII